MAEDIESWFERRRASACGTKRRFATMEEAQEAAYLLRLQTAERLEAYRCPFCQRYHLGHSSRPARGADGAQAPP